MSVDMSTQRITEELFTDIEQRLYGHILRNNVTLSLEPHLTPSNVAQHTLLDIGCGPGRLSSHLQQTYRCNHVLVDSNEDYLLSAFSHMQAFASDHGLTLSKLNVNALESIDSVLHEMRSVHAAGRGDIRKANQVVLMSNISGYFAPDELQFILRRTFAARVDALVVNVFVYEDNEHPAVSSRSLIHREGFEFTWDIGFPFTLTALPNSRLDSIKEIAHKFGYRVREWYYGDFKIERMLTFERVGVPYCV